MKIGVRERETDLEGREQQVDRKGTIKMLAHLVVRSFSRLLDQEHDAALSNSRLLHTDLLVIGM